MDRSSIPSSNFTAHTWISLPQQRHGLTDARIEAFLRQEVLNASQQRLTLSAKERVLMASFNSVILLGNLTRDPDIRYTPSGTAVATFGLAVNRRYRQGEEQREEVCFVDIVTFGRQAETVSECLSKGHLAMIEGRLQWRSWETPEGQKRSKHEVIANNVQFMPRSSGGHDGEASQPPRPAAPSRANFQPPSSPMMGGGGDLDEEPPPFDDRDIPF